MMMILSSLLLASTVGIHLVSATSWYIAPVGDDRYSPNNNKNKGGGLTRDHPFSSAFWASKALQAGDELILLDGLYANTNYQNGDIWKTTTTLFLQNLRGTPEAPIIVRGDTPTGHTLRGDSNSILQCRNCHYVIFVDLNIVGEVDNIPYNQARRDLFLYKHKGSDTILNRIEPMGFSNGDDSWTPAAIEDWHQAGNLLTPEIPGTTLRPPYYSTRGLLLKNCFNVVVINCYIHHMPGAGLIATDSDYIVFRGNTVHDCSRKSGLGTHGILIFQARNDASGQTIVDDGYRFIIENNLVYNNYNELFSWNTRFDHIKPVVQEGKGIIVAHTNRGGFDTSGKPYSKWQSGRTLVRNNIAYHNGFSGVHAINSNRIDIYHNTCYQNTLNNTAGRAASQSGITVQESQEINIKNNIAVSMNDFGGRAYSSWRTQFVNFQNNLVVGELLGVTEVAGSFVVVNASYADLIFEDATTRDFRLASSASNSNPAIKAGTPNTLTHVPKDILGTVRVSPPDIGAYEYTGSNNVGAANGNNVGFNPEGVGDTVLGSPIDYFAHSTSTI